MIDALDRTLRRSQNVVSDVHPSLGNLLWLPVRIYVISWIWAGIIAGTLRHDAPLDPRRLYHVDPQRIERTVTWNRISADRKADEHPEFRRPNYRLAGRVREGDWDTVDATVTQSTIQRSFCRHFEEAVPWEETSFYEESLDAIASGGTPWDCASRPDLDERCAFLDELYANIDKHGYKTQEELHATQHADLDPYHVIWSEIAVHVGRDGELIFQDGRNRLAIAQLLELDTIPVVILVRHAKWQRLRDRVARGELSESDLPPDVRDHPDLVELF